MIKVMIVDDEILVRLALKSSINWEANGLELVGEAEDGEQALEYIVELAPHIIITDISMPYLNGIELIRQVKVEYPHIEFIVLSCHNEFEYVKEAMQLGACDYILKLSMDIEKLVEIVNKIKGKIIGNLVEKNNNSNESIKEQKLWEGLVLDILNNTPTNNLLKEQIEEAIGVDLGEEYFEAIIFENDQENITELGVRTYRDKTIINLVEEVGSRYNKVLFLELAKGKILGILRYKNLEEYNQNYSLKIEICEQIIKLAENYLEVYISCGIGIPLKNCENIKESYIKAYRSLKHKFYIGRGTIHEWDKLLIRDENKMDVEIYDRLIEYINLCSLLEINEYIDVFMTWIETSKKLEAKVVKKYMCEILLYIKKASKELLNKSVDFISIEKAYNRVNEATYLEEVKITMKDFCEEFWKEFDYIHNKSSRSEILLAKQYILKNYAENLNVAIVSNHVNLSSDYFSHLFKKNVGISFSSYVNQIRVEKAKVLMGRGNMKVYEIAHEVGYENESYFVKKFREIVGATPIDYIKGKKK